MLPFLVFAYCDVTHEGSGFTPFGMLYGWPVRGPMKLLQGLFTGEGDVRNSTVEQIVKTHEKLADIGFLVKDNLLDRPKKLKALYDCHAKTREFSPWSSTCVLVEKKDETLWPCANCRNLNTITLFNAYPVLWINNPPVFEKIGYESHLSQWVLF
ncbi:hypothetical protein ACJMK2_027587 [Sinanodonta woodiana]|uniref:Uncharacterized protein n=1 Tax=Sinanodonta woodiana TaxID=1069815 RepID=A0ABD3X4F5_SINWO